MEELKNEVFEEVIEEVAEKTNTKAAMIAVAVVGAAVAAVAAKKVQPITKLKEKFKKHENDDVIYAEDLGCVPDEEA